jgi:hypothetical protein
MALRILDSMDYRKIPRYADEMNLVDDVDATVNLDEWASNYNLSGLVLVIVVGNTLISVAPAAILLGLPGR